jgi:DNA-binding protein HU-beta
VTKADIVDALAADAAITKRQAARIVDLVLNEITSALRKGERVALTPFGSFIVRARRAREGRNPKTGAPIAIPARRVPAFVAGKSLRDAIQKGGRKR